VCVCKYNQSGVYQLKCNECPIRCVRQDAHLKQDIKNILRPLEQINKSQNMIIVDRNMWFAYTSDAGEISTFKTFKGFKNKLNMKGILTNRNK
jgi:hypothetical protein